jgi:hypothetical protein
VALLGLATGPVVLLMPPRPGITRENYERLRAAMTLAEVEAVLGGPPGNYSRLPDREAGLWALDPDDPEVSRQYFRGREVWVGQELAVAVWFNDHQRVVRKAAFEMPPENPLDRLLRRLPW